MPHSELADLQASSFGILQANSAGGTDIALDVRKLSGIYLPSLIARVQRSDLAGKEALECALILVRDQAETTSIELQTFNVAVQQGLALILGANTFTIEQLESRKWRWSWPWLPRKDPSEVEISFRTIDEFERMVDMLHMAIGVWQICDCWRLLTELWTIFGGNKEELANFDEKIACLQATREYQEAALHHLIEASHIIDSMDLGIKALKNKINENIGSTDTTTVGLHFGSITEMVMCLLQSEMRT
ncbi:hypothetical protein K439DRAFT_1622098 [Ramaria rubella]|nr:hypothetical protein K439DRAFT_1622098 [Ramaria rubella]